MTVSSAKISSPTARAKLPESGKPVYAKLGTGLCLGYRKNAGDGAWVVRITDGKGGSQVRKIGRVEREGLPADGSDVLDFKQAAAKALAAESTTPERSPITVARALDEYEEDRSRAGGNTMIMSRLRVILAPLSDTKVSDLTVGSMSRWQRELEGKAATINRQCASVSAALNLAARNYDIADRRPWSMAKDGGLKRVERRGEARDRNIFLKDDDVRALVSASYARSAEFGQYVELMASTGVRPSQLRACMISDLQGDVLTVRQSRKGGAGKDRKPQALALSTSLANRLRVASSGRPSTDALLTKPNGEAWPRSDLFWHFKQVVIKVGLDPSVVSPYSLRHTHIMAQLKAGMRILTVAQRHETSVEEIEKHYASRMSEFDEQVLPPVDYGPAVSADVTLLANMRNKRA